jgi:4-oxalocrotonate tautomerase
LTEKEHLLPIIEVKLYDARLDDTTSPKLIDALTEALVSVLGEPLRKGTHVILDGVPPAQWGIAGKPQG